MSKKPGGQDSPRMKAEAQLARVPFTEVSTRSAEELLHELRVCQIELEMQNENLRQCQIALDESRDHYNDFYDFAPVGYLTLTNSGLVSEINLTGAALLGVDRKQLLQQRLARFVAPEDSDRWNQHFMAALKPDKKLT